MTELMFKDPDTYEWFILIAIDNDQQLWTDISKYLCKKSHGDWENDFSSIRQYYVYRAMYEWRDRTSGKFPPMTDGAFEVGMAIFTSSPYPLTTQETGMGLVKEYLSIRKKYNPEEVIEIVKESWRRWLATQKGKKGINKILLKNTDIKAEIDALRNNINVIQNEGKSKRGVSWNEARKSEDEIALRRPLGGNFKNLNKALGGGLGKKEYYLATIPTGGGKTTLCCQLAADITSSHGNVVFITTEQPPSELSPRIISYLSYMKKAPIPFKVIKDGIGKNVVDSLSPTQIEVIDEIDKELDGRLFFGDWTKPELGFDEIELYVEEVQQELRDRGEDIDLLIIDWLGGSLTARADDSNELRVLLSKYADTLPMWARKFNIPVLATVQTSRDGVGVKKVTEKYIADNKMMHRTATIAFGVSAIRNEIGDDKSEGDVYASDQFVYVFKARKAKGEFWHIRRNFDYQMFCNF